MRLGTGNTASDLKEQVAKPQRQGIAAGSLPRNSRAGQAFDVEMMRETSGFVPVPAEKATRHFNTISGGGRRLR